MGTPDFAVAALRAINESGHEIVMVVCQPDRPNSRRGKEAIPCEVKKYAVENGLDVYQPEKVSSDESFRFLSSLNADIIVTCAFGQLLRKNILEMTPYGVINIHASLLPAYRGAAPVNRVIMNGETESGVTIMHTDEGLDTGDIIISRKVDITGMTAGDLSGTLSEMGGELALEALGLLSSGSAPRKAQGGESSYADKISKEELYTDFSGDAVMETNKIRGLDPAPAAYALLGGEKRVKLYGAKYMGQTDSPEHGKILGLKDGYLLVSAKGGIVGISHLKPEGKKMMDAKAFWAGIRDKDSAAFM